MRLNWKKLTHWERWPFNVIYAPLGFLWVYYTLKARAFWFFSNINPSIEFSGIVGEKKSEIYSQLPRSYYPATIFVEPGSDMQALFTEIGNAGIKYPFIAKPDVGMHGILVRKIENDDQLKAYHNKIDINYLVQDFVDLPMEFSVFHIRYPGQLKGKVTGFILKQYLKVEGDGVLNLLQLIQQHSKAADYEEQLRNMHKQNLTRVLMPRESYQLSFAGNHNRGATFINLHEEIDQRLTDVFDKISNESGAFYYGRYDLKCTSVEDLKAGKNIYILEYNGAGSEPNHIYDCGMSYTGALKEIARHWADMYKIGRINYKNGVPYWTFLSGNRQLSDSKKFFARLRKHDLDH